jgi:hypothetical protein
VLFLALGEPDLKLGAAILPVQFQRHDGVALALGSADQAIELISMQQQFARSDRVGDLVRGGGAQRRQVRTDQKRLGATNVDIGLGELRLAGAHRLDLPALQRQPASIRSSMK